jgi:phosphatidate cytidylyltransferase
MLVGAITGGPVWLLCAFLAVFPLAFAFSALAETRQSTTVAIGITVLGTAWVGFGLGLLVLLRVEPTSDKDGRYWIFATLIAVFAADIFAYLGGRLLGRHKLAPVISPGKTWEGVTCGVVAGVLAAWITFYDEAYLEGWRSFVFGGSVVLASILGDLFESVFKRDFGVKDSGRLLAGHGGVLDRLDSLLFAGPAAYVTLLGLGAL